MQDKIMVSIICNVYNHKNYIREALDSFLMQKTNFKYEILVHDDASTDGTADIIREYEKKYPDIIKPIYQAENQHSQKVKISIIYQYPRVKGKYVAMCEGDDYWTDEYKLQKQFDAMEKHPEVDLCAHGALAVEADTKKLVFPMKPSNKDTIFNVKSVIIGGGQYVATSSLFYRKTLNDNIPEFRQEYTIDYALQIQGALRGGMLYLKDCMSCYRYMSKGSWTYRDNKDRQLHSANMQKKYKLYETLDANTDYKHTKIIKDKIAWDNFFTISYGRTYKEVMVPENMEIYKALPLKWRIQYKLKHRYPGLLKKVVSIKRRLLG